jgi:hypothetical protein
VGTELIEGVVVAASNGGATPLYSTELGAGRNVGRESPRAQVVAHRLAPKLGARAVFGLSDVLDLLGHVGREGDRYGFGFAWHGSYSVRLNLTQRLPAVK